jgi:hypothetical protein
MEIGSQLEINKKTVEAPPDFQELYRQVALLDGVDDRNHALPTVSNRP